MQKGIDLSSPSLSTHYLRMVPYGSNTVMSTGTGFLYEYENEIFIITNGHNLTRTNPQLTKRIVDSAAFPVKIKSKTRSAYSGSPNYYGLSEFFIVDLYEDEDFKIPKWYVHPEKGYLIDVVAIPLEKKDNIPSHIRCFPINNFEFDTQFEPLVSDDVFILGYPFDITDALELPIWKRGTIATEPFIDIDKLPKFYVDTASRSGMSGSPVIMKRNGLHGIGSDNKLTGSEFFGIVQKFIGIYSGRIGADDEFKAQLGIVWKEKVILEILSARQIGSIDFQKI